MDIANPPLTERIAQALDTRYFNLILFPTEQCSFRCVYCYEDFKIGRMSSETVAAVKKFVARRCHSIEQLEISWFGGEPLLAKQTIFDIQDYCRATCSGARVFGNITTNGFHLDVPTFAGLVDRGITTFQISLDGDEDEHDKTRLKKGGGGTFSRIWEHLTAISKLPGQFSVILRTHFHPANVDSVRPLVKRVSETFHRDPRIKIYLKGINKLGGPNDSTMPVFTYQQQAAIKAQITSEITGADIFMSKGPEGYVCYASRANSLAVRADGSIVKCTVALHDPKNSIGNLSENGDLVVDQEKWRYWIRGIASGNAEQLACPWRAS